MSVDELREFLEFKSTQYNVPEFIATDPVSIPRQFTQREDIEIAGFFAATMAWGNRPAILKALHQLMLMMDNAPSEFIRLSSESDLQRLHKFVYRTFNGLDAVCFVRALKQVYNEYGSLENAFALDSGGDVKKAMELFRQRFFAHNVPGHAGKHLADVASGSAGKRLNMFLRWMVRKGPVDFGIWNAFSIASLYLPLDLHTGNVSRKLGLLTRKQNDWKAVDEVTANLRLLDPLDPVKYDFALFGLGIYEKF